MKTIVTPSFCRLRNAFLLAATLVASAANAQPTFQKSFVPDTIGPGGVSTLTFTINNNSASPAADLAFSDDLPAAVVIATPANATSACGGTVIAPDGGGTITFIDGGVGAGDTCLVHCCPEDGF